MLGIRKRLPTPSKDLQREFRPHARKHYVYASAVVVAILILTIVPTIYVGRMSELGSVLAIDGALVGFTGYLVSYIPLVSSWKPSNREKISESLANFRSGMDILEREGSLCPAETGYPEAIRVLMDSFEVEMDYDDRPKITIEQEDDKGAAELKGYQLVAIEGEPLKNPKSPATDEILFGMFKSRGERYAKRQVDSVEAERDNRYTHYDILSGYVLMLGTVLVLLIGILTTFGFLIEMGWSVWSWTQKLLPFDLIPQYRI